MFPRVKLTIFHHWFIQWLGGNQATSHYLNQWWLIYWRIYVSLSLNGLTWSFDIFFVTVITYENTCIITYNGIHKHCTCKEQGSDSISHKESYCKVSQRLECVILGVKFCLFCFETWQAALQQILGEFRNSNHWSCTFETLQDIMIRHFMWFWIIPLVALNAL